MALPAQVRKQSEEVQELYRQLNPDAAGAPDGSDPAGDDGEQEDNFSDGQADGIEYDPSGEQPGGGSEQDDENSETYAQRWRSLQGTYNSTVRKLSDAETRISQLEQLFSTLSSQPQQDQAPDSRQTDVPVTLLSDDERSEYGESIDIMRKVSQEVMSPMIARLEAIERLATNLQTTVVPQVKAVSQRQQMTAEQQFWSELTAYAPNWREVNEDPAFHDWLLEVDPMTGANRQSFLEDAQRNLDAVRVSVFFRSWQDATGNAPTAQPSPKPANELAKQVAPGRTRGGGNPQSKEAKTYTPEHIKKFYADVAAGRYKGRDQERARIERDIFAAQSDGRIAAQT